MAAGIDSVIGTFSAVSELLSVYAELAEAGRNEAARSLETAQSRLLREEQQARAEYAGMLAELRELSSGTVEEAQAIRRRIWALAERFIPASGPHAARREKLMRKYADRPYRPPFEGNDELLVKMRKLERRAEQLIRVMSPGSRLEDFRLSLSGRREAACRELIDLALLADVLTEEVVQRGRADVTLAEEQADAYVAMRLERSMRHAAEWTAEQNERAAREVTALTWKTRQALLAAIPPDRAKRWADMAAAGGCARELPEKLPDAIRIGEVLYVPPASSRENGLFSAYEAAQVNGALVAPAYWDFRGNLNLHLVDEAPGAPGKAVIRGILDKLLRFSPVGKLTFTLFDYAERGDGYKPFAALFAARPELVNGRILTDPGDLEQALDRICHRMDETLQRKLTGFADYREYAERVPNAHPFETIAVLDFPLGITERACERLRLIAENGGKCGIQVLLHQSSSPDPEHQKRLRGITENMLASFMTMRVGESAARVSDSVYCLFDTAIRCDDEFVSRYTETAETMSGRTFSYAELLAGMRFQSADSRDGLRIPIGKDDAGGILNLELGQNTSHGAVITGAVGSGKSTLLHNLIIGGMWLYSPEELQFALLDFKGGTEFSVYAGHALPHIRYLAIDTKQEFGESILREFAAELERRIRLFKEAGSCRSIAEYRRKTGLPLPRLLMIIDEFQSLYDLNANRVCAQSAAHLTNILVTKGRAYGIHMILTTQTLKNQDANLSLFDSTLALMNVRIGLRQERRSMAVLFGDNGDDAYAKLRNVTGSAVYNEDYTAAGGNRAFISAVLNDGERSLLLARISQSGGKHSRPQTRIFEGGRLPALREDEFKAKVRAMNGDDGEHKAHLLLGEPIRIAPHITVAFQAGRRNNLLITGESSALHARLDRAIRLSLAACADAGGEIRIWDGADAARDEHAIAMEIRRLYAMHAERKQSGRSSCGCTVVYIKDLQWMDELRDILLGRYVEDSVGESAAQGFELFDELSAELGGAGKTAMSPGGMLRTLIFNGSRSNIHFIVTTQDRLLLNEELHDVLPAFPNKVFYAVSGWECERWLGDMDLSRLDQDTAVIADANRNVHSFRPFKML